MSSTAKDTIYIDIDDEITAIIEKVRDAEHHIVALVLPKRAAVLQSIVNMKLLKRTATETNKQVVLITSESGLLPLAGAVGLHVAKTLQTKPVIPPAPAISSGIVAVDEDVSDEPDLDGDKPVGELAGLPAEPEETIEVDNTEDTSATQTNSTPKKSSNKKLKVPNFNKFRLRTILIGAALVAVVVLWYLAAAVLPKAVVTLKTDTLSITTDINFTTKPDLDAVNVEEKILPSGVKEFRKTDTEKVAATGNKDAGTKATGTINVKNCEDSNTRSLGAGTTFTAGGKNYVSSVAKTVPAGSFSGGGTVCNSGTVDVPVAAAENGESYNRDAGAYTSSSSALQGNFKMNGSAMTGGTTKMVKVVSQQDVDGANQKINERNSTSSGDELKQDLTTAGYFPITETLISNTPTITSEPKVGEEATEAVVTATFSYTMIGVKEDDLKKLIDDSVKDDIDTSKQSVQDYGLNDAIFRVSDKKTTGESTDFFQTIVIAGTQLDKEALKKEIAGKKRGETQNILRKLPGVEDVTVDYSPFWVYSTPKKPAKIQIILEKASTPDADQPE